VHGVEIVLVVLFVVIGIVWVKWTDARQARLVEKGQGRYVVKVAGSGKGRTYHAPHCNRCKGAIVMTLEQAQQGGYNRCKFCGGTPAFESTE
jgi:transcription elongation factor Elf1